MNSFSCPVLRSLPPGIAAGVVIVIASLILTSLVVPDGHAAIQFQEVTDSAGVANTTRSYGSSWADYDGDGWPDLWTGNHNYRPRLYRNNGDGTFSNVTDRVTYIRSDYHGSAWADFDNDGDQDLIVLVGADLGTSQHPNHLFVNQNGILTEKGAALGVDYAAGRGRAPLWFDWNGDGDLDVLLVNRRREDLSAPTALFTQQDGRFFREDIEGLFPIYDDYLFFAQLSLSNRAVANMPVVAIQHWSKYPGRIYGFGPDGFQDVAGDFAFPRIDGTVTDVAIADFDGDLVNDFYLTRSNNSMSGKLFVQKWAGVVDATADAGLDAVSRESQSVAAADFDNDMDVDIYVVRANGRENYPNLLYENLGDGTFRVLPDAGGAQGTTVGIGSDVTTADFDGDGFVDLFVTNGRLDSEGPNQLFQNRGNANRWLEIDLEGRVSNRDGIGTQLIAMAGGVSQLREQSGGMHSKGQNHARIHFGFGTNTCVQQLSVRWPSGIEQALVNLPTNRCIRVVEPTPGDATACRLDARFEETILLGGSRLYTDRDDLLTAVPPLYMGMRLIKTPNDDFEQIAPNSGYLTFQMPFDGAVYVAYDSGAVQQPAWMDGFVDTGDVLETSAEDLPTFRVFGRRYNAGECVNLGANQASVCSGGGANYIVLYSDGREFGDIAEEDDDDGAADSDGEENGGGEVSGDDNGTSAGDGDSGGSDVQTTDSVDSATDASTGGGGGCFIAIMTTRSAGGR